MFHRVCRQIREALERHNASLLARIADLENRNEQLIEQMFEERKAAATRETEISDKLLAIANPLAARMAGVGRPTTPTPLAPVVQRAEIPSSRREGVRPLLEPRSPSYRPLSDFMGNQRRVAANRLTTSSGTPEMDAEAGEPRAAEEPEEVEPRADQVTYPPSG